MEANRIFLFFRTTATISIRNNINDWQLQFEFLKPEVPLNKSIIESFPWMAHIPLFPMEQLLIDDPTIFHFPSYSKS